MRILHLTLYKKWFDEIRIGFKKEEYRVNNSYWRKRLDGKSFDEIHFRNGYGKNSPFMRVECEGIDKDINVFIIKLGKVLEVRV
jgi:hypothetical protein